MAGRWMADSELLPAFIKQFHQTTRHVIDMSCSFLL
jgi:hypothetical protein